MAPADCARPARTKLTSEAQLTVLPDSEALARHVADWMVERAVEASGLAAIALSGGSTPATLYRRLAEPAIASCFPWARIHWFWGDERFVPLDHPRSNFHLAWTSFLSRVPVPPSNIHPVPTGQNSPEEAASRYEAELQQFYGGKLLLAGRPLFHINLLGLGEDGHFASLFPGCAALGEHVRWTAVAANEGEPRISLTYPALESSRHAAFLVSGEGKSSILPRVVAGDSSLPAGRFHPAGELHIFADRSAAAKVATTPPA
jgi:6-phosphogluconolactonase